MGDYVLKVNDGKAAVATLLDLDAQFERLKKRGLDLQSRVKAHERGYFTPEEDEAAGHLYISYIHTRNALLESVMELHGSGATENSPRAFLLCLGGAMLLVDAAIFLRDTFGDDKTIRDKLNEANPIFGISAGTYDQIQKSLTSPTNNWHLHHAREEFNKRREELLHQAPECKELHQRIEELIRQHQTSLAAYLKERLEVRRSEAAKNLGQNLLGGLVYNIQKSFASLMAELSTQPNHVPGLSKDIDGAAREILRPGDVIITRKEHVFTNYFLPGFWPHGALNLGTTEELINIGLSNLNNFPNHHKRIVDLHPEDPSRALEALKDGVHLRTLSSPLGADSIVILRPKLSQKDIAFALDRALQHDNKPYDFDFDFTRSDRLVCTEVVYRTYDGIADMRFKLTRRAGRMTLSAMDLIQMGLDNRHFEVVATHIPSKDTRLLINQDAVEAVQELS